VYFGDSKKSDQTQNSSQIYAQPAPATDFVTIEDDDPILPF
jgi:hypothetical protein